MEEPSRKRPRGKKRPGERPVVTLFKMGMPLRASHGCFGLLIFDPSMIFDPSILKSKKNKKGGRPLSWAVLETLAFTFGQFSLGAPYSMARRAHFVLGCTSPA